MLSPDDLEHVGDGASEAAMDEELSMLRVIAMELAASVEEGTLSGFAARAANVMRLCRKLHARHRRDVQTAIRSDLSNAMAANASDELKRALAGKEALRTDFKAPSDDLAAEYEARMGRAPQQARELYLRHAQLAAMYDRNGVKTRREAIDDACRDLAENGIAWNVYETRNGLRRVPVDVGVRQMVNDHAQDALTAQVLSIAEQTGSNLIEVSAHAGARPSHAAWQGKVYMLHGSTDEYPNFAEACHVGDPVRGYGGYNCKHTIGIYTPGLPRRWGDAHVEGYTDGEVYVLKQRQRGYENDIRKLKRRISTVEAGGGDASADRKRLNAKRAELRKLIDDNPKALYRDRWREQA